MASAGWYPDPAGSGRVRYFNGTDWTDHYGERPAPAGDLSTTAGAGTPPGYPPPPMPGPPPARGKPKPWVFVFIAAVIVLIVAGIGTAGYLYINGSFQSSVPVTVFLPRVEMDPGAKVKMCDAQVGTVSSTEGRADQTVLHLALDPSQLHLIPANVLVYIVTGAKFVQLIPPPIRRRRGSVPARFSSGMFATPKSRKKHGVSLDFSRNWRRHGA